MTRNPIVAGLCAGGLIVAALSGCVGYNVYPPEQGGAGFTDPSSPPMYQIMTQALRWAVKKYPPGGQMPPSSSDVPISPSEAEAIANAAAAGGEPAQVAIALFSSMRPDVYRYAVDQVGMGAVPLTPETEHLPTYIVSRVWVLGDEAKVDLFKPVLSLGAPGGQQVYQPITVNLRGGLKFWKVTSYRVWSIGTFAPPMPGYFPGTGPEPIAPPPDSAADGTGEGSITEPPVDLVE